MEPAQNGLRDHGDAWCADQSRKKRDGPVLHVSLCFLAKRLLVKACREAEGVARALRREYEVKEAPRKEQDVKISSEYLRL